MPKPDLTLEGTRVLARYIRATYFQTVSAVEDPEGRSRQHMAWMLHRVIGDLDMTLAKASRWVGYVQGWLVFHHHRTLHDTKNDVRAARNADKANCDG